MRIEKPWGWEELWALTDRYAGKVLHINKGHRLSLQYHEEKEETIRVLSGRLRLGIRPAGETEPVQLILEVGEVYHIAPGVVHRMEAMEGDCEVLEVSTPELDDVVRLEDDYQRK